MRFVWSQLYQLFLLIRSVGSVTLLSEKSSYLKLFPRQPPRIFSPGFHAVACRVRLLKLKWPYLTTRLRDDKSAAERTNNSSPGKETATKVPNACWSAVIRLMPAVCDVAVRVWGCNLFASSTLDDNYHSQRGNLLPLSAWSIPDRGGGAARQGCSESNEGNERTPGDHISGGGGSTSMQQ